jgi:hypothetical protein
MFSDKPTKMTKEELSTALEKRLKESKESHE